MDTLFWKQLHPDIKIETTKHLLYGKYPYRLVLSCSGTRMLRYPELSFDDQIASQRNINYGGSWKKLKFPFEHELHLLHILRDIKAELAESDNQDIKIRIEDPLLQFYSTDIKQLQDLCGKMFEQLDPSMFLISITLPASIQDLDLLNQGFVLRSNSDYAFKINFRDGRYSEDTRDSILKYLDGLGNDVKVPPNTRRQLERVQGDFMFGCYFYCMDQNIQLMLSMIHPRLIRSIDQYHSETK